MSYLFPFSRYQIKYVIKFLLRQLMTSKTLRFISIRSLKQWSIGRKIWEDKNTKIWIFQEWKDLLDETESISIASDRLSFGEK